MRFKIKFNPFKGLVTIAALYPGHYLKPISLFLIEVMCLCPHLRYCHIRPKVFINLFIFNSKSGPTPL